MKKSKHLEKLIKKLIGASFKDGKIVEYQLAKSIKDLKSLPKSQNIIAMSLFLKDLKRKERQHTMYLETASPMSNTQIKAAKKIIEKKIKITKILLSVNPKILGGFKLKIGDEVWDESVLGKVNLIKEVISGRSGYG